MGLEVAADGDDRLRQVHAGSLLQTLKKRNVDAHTCTPTLQRIQQILCVNGFGGVGDIAKEGHIDAFLHIYLLLGGAKLMNIF